jgi:hypothetical protein
MAACKLRAYLEMKAGDWRVTRVIHGQRMFETIVSQIF